MLLLDIAERIYSSEMSAKAICTSGVHTGNHGFSAVGSVARLGKHRGLCVAMRANNNDNINNKNDK